MQKKSKIKKNFKGIIETTLREGEQSVLSNFTLADKKVILKSLVKIGVDRIEIGNPLTPGVSKEIKSLLRIADSVPLLAHVRNRWEDVSEAVKTGIAGVNILCTVDQEKLKHMRERTFPSHLENLKRVISLAKENGLETRVSVEDFWGQEKKNALKVYRLADSLGVDRIGLADTLGTTKPWQVAADIQKIKKEIKAEIEVHFHNDTGCALANLLAALQAGASWADTSLLGIGERTGIVPLGTFLLRLYTIDQQLVRRYQLQYLTETENKLARILGTEIPFNLITNKKTGFSHKAGIHIHALINGGPAQYELVPPKTIGNERRIVIGSQISGRTNSCQVREFYKKFGKN